tara:strand:- start:130 stop:417 length:288 start_codon:yes stop_codon:yes gene_type:complete
MAAYAIADVEVTDPAKFQEYGNQVPATVEEYGGKYLVRGGAIEKAEGNWAPNRMVVIEFESMEQLKKWYHSQEYSGPMQLRHQSANTNVLFVEGV